MNCKENISGDLTDYLQGYTRWDNNNNVRLTQTHSQKNKKKLRRMILTYAEVLLQYL